jgi:hypothetical protein
MRETVLLMLPGGGLPARGQRPRPRYGNDRLQDHS